MLGDENRVGWNPLILKHWGGSHDMMFVGNNAAACGYVCGYATKGEKDELRADLKAASNYAVRDVNGKQVKQVMFNIGVQMQKCRRVGEHERLWRVEGRPYFLSTRRSLYYNPLPPECRWKTVRKTLDEVVEAPGNAVLSHGESFDFFMRQYTLRPTVGKLRIPVDDTIVKKGAEGEALAESRGVQFAAACFTEM